MNRATIVNYINQTEHITLISENENLLLDDVFVFSCSISIYQEQILFKVICSSDFPNVLPKFYFDNPDYFGFIPHIEPDGSVCYIEKESIYINEDCPDVVFDASVQLVKSTIENGISGINDIDFREEFQSYWERNENLGKLQVISMIGIEDIPKIVKVIKDAKLAIVTDFNHSQKQLINLFLNKKQLLNKTGLYIPLSKDSKLVPPNFKVKWSVKELVRWLKLNANSKTWQTIQNNFLNSRPERFEYIILSIPRQKGAALLAAIKFKPKKGVENPLLDNQYDWTMTPLSVRRVDSPSILPRGGANMSLQSKKILLIGCGSVGSQIAVTLGKLGVGKIDLVDYDVFRLENLNRYALGLKSVGKHKVVALEEFLNGSFLSLSAKGYPDKISNLIRNRIINVSHYDLIISATGDPNVNFQLTKLAKLNKVSLVIGWNEPYGIGGHAIISLNDTNGCYKCLYRERYNIASFTAKEQPKPFHKHHLGCGEVFTPYSFYDSIQTSQLVIKLSKQFLLGKLNKPTILSWKGESDEFSSEGFSLSSRFTEQSDDRLFENRNNFINTECTYCNN